MPVYDYKCEKHGVFHELATMDESHLPCACPQCGVRSPRIIMLAPEVLSMAQAKRQAHKTNERAANEPIFSTEDRRKHDPQHAKSCGCENKKQTNLMYSARGDKMFPFMRPWMISH